ncbi:DUF3429 domain-containing protein [Alteromonas aestuariivivens]|uniref:DUF3429 domain-containing protein n=1 Tax=Alteromonas aestuariivivens TaxID=1938339 RepID=A0A3D8M9T1_9ALTE|nr:DUF3429 domain-containing protein [Alteromonas aestuariivivens]RDV26070.1 DUF3429 domain-containing protein [Alteromonas aestuariivivens]
MPYPVITLGFAGLLPFVGLIVAALVGSLPLYEAARYFTQYSAVLLSFFGGVHWLDALQNQRTNHQLYVAMLPTIIGWLCLVFSGDLRSLGVLSLAYVLVLLYDKYVLALPKTLIISYTALRIVLTSVVVICHAVMIYLLQ